MDKWIDDGCFLATRRPRLPPFQANLKGSVPQGQAITPRPFQSIDNVSCLRNNEKCPCVPRQHTQRVVSMSREVEEMRRSFEEKLRTFSQAQNQFEQEKKVALEELKGQHRQEVQELLRSHQSQNANYSKDQEKLGQLHKAEVAHPVTPSRAAKLKHFLVKD